MFAIKVMVAIFRILELRKEKSRDAARSRRGKENYEFYELAKMLSKTSKSVIWIFCEHRLVNNVMYVRIMGCYHPFDPRPPRTAKIHSREQRYLNE